MWRKILHVFIHELCSHSFLERSKHFQGSGYAILAESDDVLRDGETDENFRIARGLPAGSYTLEIGGFDDRATGNYLLEASASPESASDAGDAEDPGDGAAAGESGGSSGGGFAWLLLVPLGLAAALRRFNTGSESA